MKTAYRPFKIIIRDKGNNISIRGSGIIFQNRRDTNIKRLRKIDLLVAQSYRVEKIYKSFLGEDADTTTLHSAVKHIEHIRGKEMRGIKSPVRFATLSGCDSIPKGARLILESLKILHGKGLGRYFELHIYGDLLEEIRGQVLSCSNVFYHGKYGVDQLNNILDGFDVGIVPSIWEEVYGYVGIEFLAKGIPVIGNMRGGIIDYTIGDLTGWVNKTASAEELSDIMVRIIKNPEDIAMLNEKIIQNRSRLIKTMDTYFNEIDKLYRGVR
ncbi:MAG: glycosyltransferase [Nitrospinae bacterium]|nr:glycosyltransferase [Nitrospinota bacterium]